MYRTLGSLSILVSSLILWLAMPVPRTQSRWPVADSNSASRLSSITESPVSTMRYFRDSGQSLGAQASNAIALGDFDTDGDLDALVINQPFDSTSSSQVMWNNGHGQFTDSGQTLSVGLNNAAKLVDVDRDGDLDAIVANSSSTQFAPTELWVNDGRGVFQVGQALSGGSNKDVAAGDLNGDGGPDIFFANASLCDFVCGGFPNDVWFNNVHSTYLPVIVHG